MTTSTTTELGSLKTLWKQWTMIVDLFVRRDLSRRHVRAGDYRTLHARLLESCRLNLDTHEAKFARRAADIATPWMSVESLNEAPAKLLEDLRKNCLIAEGKSANPGRSRFSHPGVAAAVFIALTAVTCVVTLIALDSGTSAGWQAFAADHFSGVEQTRKVWASIDERRYSFWLIGGSVGVLTALMAYCVFRSPKQT